MIVHCGTVWGRRGGSYLYAIFTTDHAYIGETGNMPTARWGSHLGKTDSSFMEKLKKELEYHELPVYEDDIVYIGLHCKVIDDEIESKRKFARLAIEDEIHKQFMLNTNSFGSFKKLLSRPTKRSARITLNFDVESFAKYATKVIIEEYNKYDINLISSTM